MTNYEHICGITGINHSVECEAVTILLSRIEEDISYGVYALNKPNYIEMFNGIMEWLNASREIEACKYVR